MITHLEPDILEYEVKWALESTTMNKASGGDGIPVELFQILKDDAVKVLHSISSKFGKLSSGHRTGKGNGKPIQYSCLENPMKCMKRQNDRILKELPKSVGAQYATGDQWRNNSRKNNGMVSKQKQHPVEDGTGDRSKI